ncbi:hypothetical protein ABE427_01270 [Acinetobacter higginsii]|uniref:hypothetical protein n=1 Tax=Acinetobacter higginsii TaxID=70347 RepID=UPI00320982F0
MELNLENFPIVEVSHLQQGSLAEFIQQLDQLLQRNQPFVLIRYLKTKFNEPSPSQVQWKQTIQWIKANAQALSLVKGWIEIAEEKVDPMYLDRDQKIWKISFYQVQTQEEAILLSQKLLFLTF